MNEDRGVISSAQGLMSPYQASQITAIEQEEQMMTPTPTSSESPTRNEAGNPAVFNQIQTEVAESDSVNQSQKEDFGHAEKLLNAIIAGNIPQIVMYCISYALYTNASDIHIEPEEKTIRIRFRVDGILRHIVEYPINIHPAVVSRIKIMSNLKIDEQRIPQDGRTQVTTEDGRKIDLRVSSLPTVNGEKIVMRLQDKTRTIPDLPELGLSGTLLKKMEDFAKLPNGIILSTGPTGSGKTNTLYSLLNRLNRVDVNIMTFEDPVEYQMDGLNQSQMRPDIDYNFATGLRTALRQDPDIIMVGEIRDQETIEIAVRAALTGHLVLSTIHTNGAIETITRIMDMGVKNFLIASSVRGIISQRLVRRICIHCKEAYSPDESILKEIKDQLAQMNPDDLNPVLMENIKLFKGRGCDKCGNLGYRGRLGIFEIFTMTPQIMSMILKEMPDSELLKTAKEEGMMTLLQDGFIKALQGLTTIDEIFRVTR